MNERTRFTPADRARAILRARRITVATGLAGAAAVVTFGGLAAISNPGHAVTTADSSTTNGGTDTTTTDDSGSSSTTNGVFQAPVQLPIQVFGGGGQTTTGGS